MSAMLVKATQTLTKSEQRGMEIGDAIRHHLENALPCFPEECKRCTGNSRGDADYFFPPCSDNG